MGVQVNLNFLAALEGANRLGLVVQIVLDLPRVREGDVDGVAQWRTEVCGLLTVIHLQVVADLLGLHVAASDLR